ncbi:MAG TPA: 50S ribosomal protein L15 [Candidatus Polarisedimenticolia bacterium]|nr:50S ribosomal protein L15 [Candidatus Polarisedimenticolia bacterium]
MKIHELKPPAGAHKSRKRIGRGNGSGHGTYAGRGVKGQKARSGARIPAWFEGGQMPLQRRLPKRGFSRARFRVEVQSVNLSDLARFEDEKEFDRERMAALGMIDGDGGPVKILARGKIERAVTVRAEAFSEAARAAIEAAGGKAETVEAGS